MIDVIVNEPPLCLADRLLDGLQLLRKLEAAAAFIEIAMTRRMCHSARLRRLTMSG
jgi:hypothetical protein